MELYLVVRKFLGLKRILAIANIFGMKKILNIPFKNILDEQLLNISNRLFKTKNWWRLSQENEKSEMSFKEM